MNGNFVKSAIIPPINATINCKSNEDPKCQHIFINTNHSGPFRVLCLNETSCLGSNITINMGTVTDFEIDCYEEYSCQNLLVNIMRTQEIGRMAQINVTCYKDNSCENFVMKTSILLNASITVNILQYSNNIHINYEYTENIEINCGSKYDHRYIEYFVNDPSSDDDLLTQAALTYDSKKLPCQDVIIDDKCRYEYGITQNIGIFDNKASIDECYWIELKDLLDVKCVDIPIPSAFNQKTFNEIMTIIFSIIVFILLIMILIFLYIRYRAKKLRIAQTITIRNAMVIPIGIAFYDEKPKKPEIDGILQDLTGILVDIDNAVDLFGKNSLNYSIFPKIYEEQQDDLRYKARWGETELVEFLQKQANALEYNLVNENDESKKYDALIVIISCHGLEGYILSSDYKKINKTAIHRIFSGKKPVSRTIPRIFIFDCCAGSNERDAEFREDEKEEDKGKSAGYGETDTAKNTEVDDIVRDGSLQWAIGEVNPDYKLVVVNAANDGFQSKMRCDTGSYVVTQITERLYESISNKDGRFLHQILDDVQEDLHTRGKQLMVKTFNNKTEYIIFEEHNDNQLRSPSASIMETEIEGSEMDGKTITGTNCVESMDKYEDTNIELQAINALPQQKSTAL